MTTAVTALVVATSMMLQAMKRPRDCAVTTVSNKTPHIVKNLQNGWCNGNFERDVVAENDARKCSFNVRQC